MHVARSLSELRAAREAVRSARGRLTLVPTMGALHPGHLALMREAVAIGGGVIASIFVNPLQFGPKEDFARYPRDEARDLAALEAVGCDIVWLPDVATMYAPDEATVIEVAGPARRWEGVHRPGHFRGVATVCAKLFGQAGAELAVFGEKDWQQIQVVKRVVADLFLPIRVVAVPTVREADGLALSSRNRFLSEEERARAPLLFATLQALARELAGGAPAAGQLRQAEDRLEAGGLKPDYLALVHAETLEPIEAARPPSRLLAAARLGSVRLLDNVGVS